MIYSVFLICLLFNAVTPKIDVNNLKCLVCRAMVEEVDKFITKVDPKKTVEVGGYRLDSNGNQKQKTVPYATSEVFLTETLEKVCDKMDDYVRATYKASGELTILRIVTDNGKMNPEMSNVDIIQDSDLNKSLKFYCEEVVGEHEEEIINLYATNVEHVDLKLCSSIAHYCPDDDTIDDYNFEDDKDEL